MPRRSGKSVLLLAKRRPLLGDDRDMVALVEEHPSGSETDDATTDDEDAGRIGGGRLEGDGVGG